MRCLCYRFFYLHGAYQMTKSIIHNHFQSNLYLYIWMYTYYVLFKKNIFIKIIPPLIIFLNANIAERIRIYITT